MSFEQDILSRDTNLFPIVTIGEHKISTNSFEDYKPILLNIPSLKESIDLETRKYKISNVTLNISNFPYDGVSFSDSVTGSLINEDVNISWRSPSDSKPIYNGTVRQYTHDDEKVTLVVEDRSQVTLHKDLPLPNTETKINWLGTGDDVPDKYKNKPIPMVYGEVDRSPCVIKTRIVGSDVAKTLEIISDNTGIASYVNTGIWHDIYNQTTDSLWVFRNDEYFNIKKAHQDDYATYVHDNYIEVPADGMILLEPKYNADGTAANAIGDNILETDIIRIPQTFNIPEDYSPYVLDNPENIIKHTMLSSDFAETQINDFHLNPLLMIPLWRSISDDDVVLVKHYSLHNIFEETVSSGYSSGYVYFRILFDYDFVQFGERSYSIPDDQAQMTEGISCASNNMHNTTVSGADINENLSVTAFEFQDSTDANYDSGYWSKTSLVPPSYLKYIYTASGTFSVGVNINIKGIGLYQKICFDKIDKGDFYANVVGRISATPTTPDIISDILNNELGQTVTTDNTGYTGWQYAFTINEKINSKTLIEQISSASPYIPHFTNTGIFKFDVIKDHFTATEIEDLSEEDQIKKTDIINFSYSRTRIEDVYTKVEFKYNWDYAREEFNDVYTVKLSDLDDANPLSSPTYYDYGFYGFDLTADDPDIDSTLVVDDDRGKYIRNNDPDENGDSITAVKFAKWLLMWNCNQHIKMKIKLPLKYMGIEVGKEITFDEEFGDYLPYGIQYAIGASDSLGDVADYVGNFVNGSQAYPVFKVISTNKTLEFVDIECIQMHNLYDGDPTRYGYSYGCTNPDAWNYDGSGDNWVDDGSCVLGTTFIVNENNSSCPLEIHPATEDPDFYSETGEEEVPDVSENYTGDLFGGTLVLHDGGIWYYAHELNDGNFRFLNHMEIEGDPLQVSTGTPEFDSYTAVMARAETYYNPDGGVEPTIYSYLTCQWVDSNSHNIINIEFMWVGESDEEEVNLASINWDTNTIEFQVTQEMIDWYNENGDVIKFKYRATFEANAPSFAGDANYSNRFEYLGTTIYTYEHQMDIIELGYVWEAVIEFNDIFSTETQEIEISAAHKLVIPSLGEYYEFNNYDGDTDDPIKTINLTLPDEEEEILLGDMNDDGALNILDIVGLINVILYGEYNPVGDMNSDGTNNILDIVNLINEILYG